MASAPETIDTSAGLTRALADLAAADPDLGRAAEIAGPLPVRARAGGFASLLKIIVDQQLSTASANAIWRRLEAAAGPVTADSFLALDDGALAAAGLSRPKQAYGRHIAQAVASGGLDLEGLGDKDDAAALEALVALKGVGRWTAEIYLLFCLDRPDIWPAQDLALQVAVQHLKTLDARPGVAEMDAVALPWRPWRGTAARLLWRYYRVVKGRLDPGAAA